MSPCSRAAFKSTSGAFLRNSGQHADERAAFHHRAARAGVASIQIQYNDAQAGAEKGDRPLCPLRSRNVA